MGEQMIYAVVLGLASFVSDVQAHILIENPNRDGWVSKADAILMDDNPGIVKALKRIALEKKWFEAEEADMFFDNGFGGYVVALQLMRSERETELKKKKKPKVKD